MNPVPFLWLAAVVGFLLLEASTFSMTSVWFAVGSAFCACWRSGRWLQNCARKSPPPMATETLAGRPPC